MSLSYIMARMQLLSGTTEEWTGETGSKKDLVLMSNELAAEWGQKEGNNYSEFKGIKIGDGEHCFSELEYITSQGEKTTVLVGGNPVQTFDADTKLNKVFPTDGIFRAYTVNGSGVQQTSNVDYNGTLCQNKYIPMYQNDSVGTTQPSFDKKLITNDPVNNYHAANKKYVDETVTAMGDTKVSKMTNTDNVYRVYCHYGTTDSRKMIATSPALAIDDGNGNLAVYGIPARTSSTTISGHLMTGIPVYNYDAANKKYVDDNFVSKSGDTITGDLSITGDLTVQGTTYTQDSETLRIADNIIEINSDKTDNTTALSGIAINKDASSTYGIMYDPSNNTVKFGEGKTKDGEFSFKDGEGAPLAVRDDSDDITDGAIMIFDKSKNRLVDSGYTVDTFKQWVKDYIELYMSTTIVENEAGGETLDINTNNYTEENGTLTIGG